MGNNPRILTYFIMEQLLLRGGGGSKIRRLSLIALRLLVMLPPLPCEATMASFLILQSTQSGCYRFCEGSAAVQPRDVAAWRGLVPVDTDKPF